MKRRKYLLSGLLLLALGAAQAQTTYTYDFRGLVVGQADFGYADMVNFSRTNYSMGTARSAAMGGAFTSLGADLSSMSINPAGLGMYRSTEFGMTAALGFNHADNASPWGKNNRTRFAINNIGAACNVFNSSGTVMSVTLGFGYNKLADFNFRSSLTTPNSHATVADLFARQLNGTRVGDLEYRRLDQNLWGAMLAYKNFLIDPVASGDDNYEYFPGSIFEDATVSHLSEIESRGHIGEYAISVGANIDNIVYLGFTLGLQDIHQEKTVYYGEDYRNNGLQLDAAGSVTGIAERVPSPTPLILSDYAQTTVVDGVGVNFKLGAIVRPVAGLRIGLAVHSPTFADLNRSYRGFMYVRSFDIPNDRYIESDRSVQFTDELRSKVKYNTPTRMLAGVSYTFGQVAILSFDYERAWYNGMRLRDTDEQTKEDYKDEVKKWFDASNNVRVGAEVRPLPYLALRAGYAYSGSMLKADDVLFDSPLSYRSQSYSAGIGFNFGNVNLDLAYVYTKTDQTSYELFRVDEWVNGVAGFSSNGGMVKTDYTQHMAMLSLGIRLF